MSHKRLGHAGPGGKGQSPTYTSWRSMIHKALDGHERPRVTDAFGALHGTNEVDPRWIHFENFLADMGERPADHRMCRIAKHLGFNKANCEWRKIRGR